MNKNLTTPFGQLNGEIMHVNAVPFELRKSEFICSCCSSRLQIIEKHERGTSVVSAHFRHVDKERECNPESVAHAYWKQQIVDRVGKTMKFSELGECEVLQAEKEVTLGFKTGFTNKLNETVRVDCLQLVKDADGNEHTVAIEVNISNKKKEREIEIFQRLGIKVYELTVNSKENKMVGFENLNKFNAWKETQRKNELQASKSEIEASNLRHRINDLREKRQHEEQLAKRNNAEILEDLKNEIIDEYTKRHEFFKKESETLEKRIIEHSKNFDVLAKSRAKQDIVELESKLGALEAKARRANNELLAIQQKHEVKVAELANKINAEARIVAEENLKNATNEFIFLQGQVLVLEEEINDMKNERKGLLGATVENELLNTRKVNAVLEERVKRANKAILEAIKQGFKTDYKF